MLEWMLLNVPKIWSIVQHGQECCLWKSGNPKIGLIFSKPFLQLEKQTRLVCQLILEFEYKTFVRLVLWIGL